MPHKTNQQYKTRSTNYNSIVSFEIHKLILVHLVVALKNPPQADHKDYNDGKHGEVVRLDPHKANFTINVGDEKFTVLVVCIGVQRIGGGIGRKLEGGRWRRLGWGRSRCW